MPENVRCPKCASGKVLFSLEHDPQVCKDCGYKFILEKAFTPKRVFLSYGHDEHALLAHQIKDDLIARGHEVWFDLDRLKPGGDWERYIEEGLDWVSQDQARGRVVLLMTPHSVRRRDPQDKKSTDGYCLNEIARAIIRNLLIIPIMVVWCEPPLSICRIQWLDMRDCVAVALSGERYELKRQRLIEALEEDKLDFEGTQATLLQRLNPLDFKGDLAKNLEDFVGRQWVLARFDEWVQNPGEYRVLWLTGSPGVGKTAIAAYLCHRRKVVAFHLCRHGHDDKGDSRRCVLSLAYYLSTQLFEYQNRLINLLGDLNKSAATLFDNLIVQPLHDLAAPPPNPVVIVIDGLDEATKHGRNELVELIKDGFPYTPPWLLLFITSRRDNEVVQPLQHLSPMYLEAGSPENLEDVRQYLQSRLSALFPGRPPDPKVIEAILGKSEGLFLYVVEVLKELKEGRLSLSRLGEFPQGLGGIFERFFLRQFPEISRFRERHRPLLEMILAARGPLPLDMARQALKWGPYDYYVDAHGETGGEALTPLGSLFPQSGGQISPFHRAVIDWLTDPQKAGDYFIDIQEGHKRLAEVGWAEFQASLEKLSPYSRDHLPTHMMEAERWEDLLTLVKSPGLGLINRWVEEGEGQMGLTCLEGLIDYLKKLNHRSVTAAGLATQVARIHSLWGQYDQSRKWLSQALAQTSWWRGRRAAAIALHELGSLAIYQKDFDTARRCYRRALWRCRLGLPIYHDEAAANWIGLATIALTRYLFADSLKLALKGLRAAFNAGDIRHLIAGYRLMGANDKSLGRFEEARRNLDKGLWLCERFNVLVEKNRLLLLKGWLEYDLATLRREQPQAAEVFFQTALEGSQKVFDRFCYLEAQLSLASCALAANNPVQAQERLAVLGDLPATREHVELVVHQRLAKAHVDYQFGHKPAAEAAYREIIDLAGGFGERLWLWRAVAGLGAVCWHSQRQAEAEECWAAALQAAGRISPAKQDLAQASIAWSRENPRNTPL